MKFKVGDRVVPFKKTWSCTFDEWMCSDKGKIKFFKENGFLYIVKINGHEIVLNDHSERGGGLKGHGDIFYENEIYMYCSNKAVKLFEED